VPATHAGIAAQAYGDMTAGYDDDDDDDDRRRWDRRDRRDRYERYGRYNRYNNYNRNNYNRYQQRGYYGEPVYNNTRVWRGNDGRVYCRKSDGTTGLIIGGAAGALLGRELAGRGDRTLGAILGAAGGALLGKSIDSKTRCN
jgi:hypothetical protein